MKPTDVAAAIEIGRLAKRILALAPDAGLYVGIRIEPARDSGSRSQSQDAQRLGPEAGRTVREAKSPTPSPFSGDPQ